MSAAAHVAVVAAAVAAGTRQLVPPRSVELVRVHFTTAPPTEVPQREAASTSARADALARMLPPRVHVPRLAVASVSPAVLPTIQFRSDGVLYVPRSGSGTAGDRTGVLLRDLLGNGDGDDGRVWGGAEASMRAITSAMPRYPEALRSSGVEGTVLVQFVVDTAGRVDMATVKVLRSTHDVFTRAALDALPRFRFRPASVAGRRVPALAQMPFEFRLRECPAAPCR